MSEIALKLIAENKRTKKPFLDLGLCDLKNFLPNELLDCVWLERLNLGSSYFDKESKKWENSCNCSKYNSFNGSELSILKNLYNLQSLDLNSTNILDISFLEDLIPLKFIDLSSNQISDFTYLGKLSNLQSLDLSNNGIKDFDFLDKLLYLKNLNLSSNSISMVNFLEKLTELTLLDLSSNRISDISFLSKLINLTYLDISNNTISYITEETVNILEDLKKLKELNLSSNKIQDLRFILPLLRRGMSVNLDKKLDKKYNSKLQNEIWVGDNEIRIPPIEILQNGNKVIIEYFEEKNKKSLNECKLIFVGDGGVGKTSLMRRIVSDDFDNLESTTHGINKVAWEAITNDENEPIRINFWDFGGQQIQHSLHQFFFTERVIYTLVLNPRNDQNAHYWLDQIEKLGKESEILIVYNWKQEADKEAEFLGNFYELRKKFNKILGPFILSCKTGEGLSEFKEAIKDNVLKNGSLKTQYLEKWFKIKNRLEQEVSVGKNYITYEIFERWCIEEDYKDSDKQKELLKILNSIGSIVFFDKPSLAQLQILNPDWLSAGAYSILVAKQTRENKGHLSWSDLKSIFEEEKEIFSNKKIKIKYKETQFQFILELMIDYNLCQRNPFNQNEFLIPSAFGEKPNKDYSFAKKDARHYRLEFESPFEMLIIHRFIAKNLLKVQDKDYWKSGIFIKHPDSMTHALIETNLYSRYIDCWITGQEIVAFWKFIRSDFREILSIYNNFTIVEKVLYQKGNEEVFISHDELISSLNNGIKSFSYHPTYQIKNFDVRKALELFEGNNKIILITNSSPDYYTNKQKILPYSVKSLKVQGFEGIIEANFIASPIDTNWLFLIGENSYGKTTILRSIAIGFIGESDQEVDLFESNSDSGVGIEYFNSSHSLINNVGQNTFKSFPHLACYGPSRLQIQTEQTQNDVAKKSTTTYSLFNADGVLLNIEFEMLIWYLEKNPRFDAVKQTFLKLIPYLSDIQVDVPKRKVFYIEKEPIENGIKYNPVTFNELASGFRSILAMIGDMMIRLFKSQSDVTEPSELAGIVIIDEIDLHWHPKMQREIPSLLSSIFPKIQFIASTHSLVPLLGAPENSVLLKVNRTVEEGITVEKMDIDFQALSSDVMLRDIFDLEKYQSDAKQKAWERYTKLKGLIHFEKDEAKKKEYIHEREVLGDKYNFTL
jgi:internalin A